MFALPVRALIIFLIANALKSATIYNYFASSRSIGLFLLHFIPSLAFSAFVFLLILKHRSRILFISAYLANILFLLVNVCFYWHFNNFIHLNHFSFLLQEGIQLFLGQSVALHIFYLIVLADLPAFLYLLILFPQSSLALKRVTENRRIFYYLGSFLALTHVIIFTTGIFDHPSTSEGANDRQIVLRHGLLVHNFLDALKDSSHRSKLNEIAYGSTFSIKEPGSGPHSIIMIQVESLDAFIVNYRHRDAYVAPFLHGLTQKSIYYPYALTTRRAGVTSDCELAVLNSIEPFEKFPSLLSENYSYPNSIPKSLQKKVSDIYAFHGNSGSFYDRAHAYPKMGFKKFFDIEAMGLNESGWGAPDSALFDFVEKKLAEETGPFFYYLITMSSHEPFQSPLRYYSTDKYDDLSDSLARNYFRSISYVDMELEKFVCHAAEIHPEAYIFIYGDHTPFSLRDEPYHRAYFKQNDLEFEFVPLFIITPDHRIAKEGARTASFLDLSATILSASGVSATISSNGTNLLKTPLRESSVLLHGEKYDRKNLFDQIDRISPNK